MIEIRLVGMSKVKGFMSFLRKAKYDFKLSTALHIRGFRFSISGFIKICSSFEGLSENKIL
jgi:hypothetical protein